MSLVKKHVLEIGRWRFALMHRWPPRRTRIGWERASPTAGSIALGCGVLTYLRRAAREG